MLLAVHGVLFKATARQSSAAAVGCAQHAAGIVRLVGPVDVRFEPAVPSSCMAAVVCDAACCWTCALCLHAARHPA